MNCKFNHFESSFSRSDLYHILLQIWCDGWGCIKNQENSKRSPQPTFLMLCPDYLYISQSLNVPFFVRNVHGQSYWDIMPGSGMSGILSVWLNLIISAAMATPKITLTYFNVEAAAEKVRLALVMTGTPFEDKRINFEEWGAMKPTTPYGQLPLMTITNADGSTKTFAQSVAMMRWVARKFDSTNTWPSCNMLQSCTGNAINVKK